MSTTVIFIPQNHRVQHNAVISEIANTVFENTQQTEFMEEFVPVGGRVPAPKITNFINFISRVPTLLWAIQEDFVTVGFIFVINNPGNNLMGIGINRQYANSGVGTRAFNLIRDHQELIYPLTGETSVRNVAGQKLMETLGFQKELTTFNFHGETSYRYTLKN
jgi:RimJ/RimL family protein N-acetyltransferase